MKKSISSLILILLYSHSLFAQDIFQAVNNGNLDSVKVLIEDNPDLLYKLHPNLGTPLHNAVWINNKAIIAYLIEKGAPLDALDDTEITPLYITAYSDRNLDLAKFLIEKGADINIISKFNMSILGEAVRNAPQIADYLLDCGVRIPSPEDDSGKDMLMNSARNGLVRLFDKLISLDADINERGDSGNCLLHEAAYGGQNEIIEKLIIAGLDVNSKNTFGWNPLHFAAEQGQKETVALLLDNGAEINARTIDGNTAYNLAVEMENGDVAELLSTRGADKSERKFPKLTGKYLGQSYPGKKAELFAPGIISTRYNFHGSLTFSLDGKEAYWNVTDYGKKKSRVIMESKIENGFWTYPKPAYFAKIGVIDDSPFISPDGQKFLFTSWRPLEKDGEMNKECIWMLERTGNKWSEPEPLPPVINTIEESHQQASMDSNGNIYFGGRRDDSHGSLDIYCSKYEDGEYRKPVNLGPMINSSNVEFTPYIAPDGSFLIFCRYKTVGWSLFISFLDGDGNWTEAVDMNEIINYPGEMDSPNMSRDGKVLFFTGGNMLQSTKLYWIDASFIEELRSNIIR
ncbi:ankyrin repeat domain-containing protein [candidate division KSB1 bacterium]